MAFLEINLDDVTEPKPVPQGFYALQITEAKVGKTGDNSKNPGAPQFIVSLAFEDEPDAPNISHYVGLPSPGDEEKALKFKALMLKRFLSQFNIPYDPRGLDLERMAMEMVGQRANCDVEISEPDAKGNTYNRLRTPKLQG
jgi:hypothetical protein